jgi:hypothetical protein
MNIFCISHKGFVGVRVVAFPAGEFIDVMSAVHEFLFDHLEIILCIGLIVSMAIHASILLFNPALKFVRKYTEFLAMAIGTGKRFVYPGVISCTVNDLIRTHRLGYGAVPDRVNNGKLGFPMATEAGFVFHNKIVHLEKGGIQHCGV